MGDRIDRASYRNRDGLFQWLVSAYKAKRYLTKAGSGIVIIYNAEFALTAGAVLEIGDACTIQNYAFFQLSKPHPKVIIGNNTVIGRHCMITAKNLIQLGDDVRIGPYV